MWYLEVHKFIGPTSNPSSKRAIQSTLKSFAFRSFWQDIADGRNPAPVDMVNISLFTRFPTCWVVKDFFHQQYCFVERNINIKQHQYCTSFKGELQIEIFKTLPKLFLKQGDLSTATPYNLDKLSNTSLFGGCCFYKLDSRFGYQETNILRIFQCMEMTHRSLTAWKGTIRKVRWWKPSSLNQLWSSERYRANFFEELHPACLATPQTSTQT